MTPNLAVALANRYRIDRELGQGGMATVWLAEDLKHDRKVAIKVLKPELAAVLGAERFVQEIRTTAALTHPHILPLFDSGEAESFLYYVMPYLQGQTIREKLNREHQLGIDESVRIVTEIADALDYAHRHGVIHRDIKPENILLHDGRPMVMDFGIALAVSAAAGGRMTETGLSLGTPHYMSPEQATADREITGRSDIYSLASVLYEMLSGEPPHMGTSAQQIIMKIIVEPVRRVTTLRKNVPANVADALEKALEKLPADRFATAREFSEALANQHYTTTTSSAWLSPTRRGFDWLRVGLGVLAGTLIGAAGWHAMGPEAVLATFERQQFTFEGLAVRVAISPDGSRVAYVREVCENAGSSCRSSLLIQEIGASRSTALLKNILWAGTPHWSADGRTVVLNAELDSVRQGLFAMPLRSDAPQLISPRGPHDTHALGDSVAVVRGTSDSSSILRVLNLQTGGTVDSVPLKVGGVNRISWSPDGRRFAILNPTGLSILDRQGAITGSYEASLRNVVRWHPDGESVLAFRVGVGREDELVRFRVRRDGRLDPNVEIALPRIPTLLNGEFDIARRTGTLAIVTGEMTTDIHFMDLAARPPSARRLTRGTTYYGAPALTPDGRGVYYLQGDASGDNLYHVDLSLGTGEALTAFHFPGAVDPRLSSDGRRVIYGHASDSGDQLSEMELPSRRARSVVAPPAAWQAEPVGAKGLLGLERDGSLSLADSLGASWRAIPFPDSLRTDVWNVAAASDGRRAAVLVLLHSQYRLLEVSLDGGVTRQIAILPSEESRPSVQWAGDTLFVARGLARDPSPSLWRVHPSTGALTRVSQLPVPCSQGTVSIALGGRAAVCNVSDTRSDVWIYRVPRLAR